VTKRPEQQQATTTHRSALAPPAKSPRGSRPVVPRSIRGPPRNASRWGAASRGKAHWGKGQGATSLVEAAAAGAGRQPRGAKPGHRTSRQFARVSPTSSVDDNALWFSFSSPSPDAVSRRRPVLRWGGSPVRRTHPLPWAPAAPPSVTVPRGAAPRSPSTSPPTLSIGVFSNDRTDGWTTTAPPRRCGRWDSNQPQGSPPPQAPPPPKFKALTTVAGGLMIAAWYAPMAASSAVGRGALTGARSATAASTAAVSSGGGVAGDGLRRASASPRDAPVPAPPDDPPPTAMPAARLARASRAAASGDPVPPPDGPIAAAPGAPAAGT